MNSKFQVLVLGGGVVGLSAALAMAARGYSVAVLDAGSLEVDTSQTDLRVYAINHASQTLLEELGAWKYLEQKRLAPYGHMHVWDGINGGAIDFDSREVAAPYLGTIIEESLLRDALLKQTANQKNISLFPNSCIEEVRSEAERISISSQQREWEGQLLMVADGANSPTRKKLQVELTHWSYNQHAVVAAVEVEKEHQNTAYQIFNLNGPLAFLPLPDPHQCSIVWSTDPVHAEELMGLSEAEFNEAVTKAFAAKLGQVQLLSVRRTFPLEMRHVREYTGDRWLLLGDAAHTIHPLAGLGLNVGLADLACWIKLLDKTKGNLSSRKTLKAYQRERKHGVWQVILLMEGLKHLFGTSFPPIVGLRGLGLGLCNKLTPLKQRLIDHARGNV